jgi:RNA recognition motif-containing protein
MPTKLFVASLPSLVTNSDLLAHFSQFGPVTKVEISKNQKKLSKGFAFVTFLNESDAETVLNSEIAFKDRVLTIRRNLKGQELKNYTKTFEQRRMYVGNLSLDVSDSLLRSFFSKFAPVENAYVIRDFKTGLSSRFGYVLFHKIEDVDFVVKISQSGLTLNGAVLVCERFKGKSDPQNFSGPNQENQIQKVNSSAQVSVTNSSTISSTNY